MEEIYLYGRAVWCGDELDDYAFDSDYIRLSKTKPTEDDIRDVIFDKKKFILTIAGLTVASVAIYSLDKFVLHGIQPLLDTMSLSIAIVANILCSFCYKEQWILWFVLDVIQTILYFIIGQPILGIMYIGWTINCVYGWYQWNKHKNKELGIQNV